jgi:plasmid stability protein
MSTLTIRIPEAKHARLRRLAARRGVSMNKLIDELATVALAQHDAEIRFQALAAKGSVKRGLELLDKLDRAFGG